DRSSLSRSVRVRIWASGGFGCMMRAILPSNPEAPACTTSGNEMPDAGHAAGRRARALSGRRIWRGRCTTMMLAIVIVILSGCAELPRRDSDPAPATPQQMRERVTVRDEHGRADARPVRRVLAEVGKEGR